MSRLPAYEKAEGQRAKNDICDIGIAYKHTSVYDVDYTSPFEYNGIIEKVVIDVADSSVDVKEELEKALHVD